ncbi:MAG: FUSC family membrane protein, partial [Jatrophihabitantaceae bacterium]
MFAALIRLLRSAARLDRTQSDPIVSLRNAIGVAAPLAIGALLGNAAFGLPSTIGALQTAFADRPGPYRLRMLRMLGTALAAGITSTLAVLFSRTDVGSALLLLVLAFCAGLLLTGGPSATQVGVAATGAALVLGHSPEPGSVALHIGLLVLIGGVGQTLLAVAAWPLRRHQPERLALAGLYRELAEVARRPPGTGVGPPAGDTLTAVRLTLYGLGHDHGPSVEAYRVLLDEAERIRREVLVLDGLAERLRTGSSEWAAAAIGAVLSGSAGMLAEIADALHDARAIDPAALDRDRTQIRSSLGVIEDAAVPGDELTRRAAAARIRSLSGQV